MQRGLLKAVAQVALVGRGRKISMVMPRQVPSSAFIAKGGATFVPTTSSRVAAVPAFESGPAALARGLHITHAAERSA
jgi:hypothetical protein